MRWFVFMVAFLMSGCAAVDDPDASTFLAQADVHGFTATYSDPGGCRLNLTLGPSEPVARGDLLVVDAWGIDWDFSGPAKECMLSRGTHAVDDDIRTIRATEQWCWSDRCNDVTLRFDSAGGLAPFGIAWPHVGDTTHTVVAGNRVDVTVVEDDGWRHLSGLPHDRAVWPIVDTFRYQMADAPIPSALTWLRDGAIDDAQVFHLDAFTPTERLPALQQGLDLEAKTRLLKDPAPGSDLNAYHFGFSLDDAVAAAVEQDDAFAAVLETGCIGYAGTNSRGRAWAGAPGVMLVHSSEDIDLTLEARNKDASRVVEVTYDHERTATVETPQGDPIVSQEASVFGPGACPEIHHDGTTIEDVRDALWDLPINEDYLPCAWTVLRPPPIVPGDARMIIDVQLNGFPHTGTFWNHWPEEDDRPFPERFTSGQYDVTRGEWAVFFGLTRDEVAALDAETPGDRVEATHDDEFFSWCRYVDHETPLVPPPGEVPDLAAGRI